MFSKGKRLAYVLSMSLVLGLALTTWVTSGFQEFTQWRDKPFIPFLWGISIVAISLSAISLANPIAAKVEQRTTWELWGRGSLCGMMIAILWACSHAVNLILKEAGLDLGVYPAVIGLIAAIGLGLYGAVSERYLSQNLEAAGWLIVVVGGVVATLFEHPTLALLVMAAGFSIVLVKALVTGRIDRAEDSLGYVTEVTRDDNPGWFPLYLVGLTFLAVACIILAIVVAWKR